MTKKMIVSAVVLLGLGITAFAMKGESAKPATKKPANKQCCAAPACNKPYGVNNLNSDMEKCRKACSPDMTQSGCQKMCR